MGEDECQAASYRRRHRRPDPERSVPLRLGFQVQDVLLAQGRGDVLDVAAAYFEAEDRGK